MPCSMSCIKIIVTTSIMQWFYQLMLIFILALFEQICDYFWYCDIILLFINIQNVQHYIILICKWYYHICWIGFVHKKIMIIKKKKMFFILKHLSICLFIFLYHNNCCFPWTVCVSCAEKYKTSKKCH